MFVSGNVAKAAGLLVLPLVLLALPIAATARSCPAAEIRAMTYNIRLDLVEDGANAWPYRRNELIGQVELLRPDVFGMQEVVSNQRRDMMAALPGFAFVGVGRDDGKDAGEYSPLGIRKAAFRVGSSGTFWLSPTPDRPSKGWDAAYTRIATWAHLAHRASGASVLALSTHWDNEGLVARREGAALIARWIAANRRPGEHVLLLGDFNATMAEDSLKQLTDAGLVDSRAVAREVLGGSTTYNDFKPLPAADEAPIDHIMVGPEWRVRRNATVAYHVSGKVPSDHFPVVADLALACS